MARLESRADAPDAGQPLTPTIPGDRVRLRGFEELDVGAVFEAAKDPGVRLLTGLEADQSSAQRYVARQELRSQRGLGHSWVIVDAARGYAVGQIGMWIRATAPDGRTGYMEEAHGRAALGYWVKPGARSQGFATAALQAASEWALSQPDIERLELFVEPSNGASLRVALGAGYQREGLLRSYQRIGHERRDMIVLARLS
ncbi:GNAT family N-acetyltransferase [Nocardioides bruguierae]|uniref:GNAT family N-acetyltransferase n=1 Tax=Nocardioides bruguierae TaxID=2945102 RepID=UPI002547E535|nr:GNAT family protein [Nocardioides bruguierae]